MAKIYEFPKIKKTDDVNKETVLKDSQQENEDNVVSIGKNKPEMKGFNSEMDDGEDMDFIMKMFVKDKSGLSESVLKFSKVVMLLHSLRKSDPGKFNIKKIEEKKIEFSGNSDEELKNLVESYDDNYIKTHPNTAQAVVDLLLERDYTLF